MAARLPGHSEVVRLCVALVGAAVIAIPCMVMMGATVWMTMRWMGGSGPGG